MTWFEKPNNYTFSQTELEEVLKGILFIILHKPTESNNCASSIDNFTAHYDSGNVFKLFQDDQRYSLGTKQTSVSLEHILKDLKMSVGSKFQELPVSHIYTYVITYDFCVKNRLQRLHRA